MLDGTFDTFKMLRSVSREHHPLRSLFRRDLVEVVPEFTILAQGVHYDLVTQRRFGMAWAGVVFLIDRMMDERSFHDRKTQGYHTGPNFS